LAIDSHFSQGMVEIGRSLWFRISPRNTSRANPQPCSMDGFLFAIGVAATPISIAGSECALAGSLLFRLVVLGRERSMFFPRVFWFWSAWAILELAVWLSSRPLRAGVGEIRHLALVLAMFFLLPGLGRSARRIAVWRGAVAAATLSSAFLVAHFVSRMFSYRRQVDPMIYFRYGGFVHHWMVYGTIEIIVWAALLEFLRFYPRERWWLIPALMINIVAIVLSLTRMLWIAAVVLLAIHLARRRSRWIWVVPVALLSVFLLAPPVVRLRISESIHADYYSNSERVQMLRVGWKMVRAHPVAGVGPGRVEQLYTTYLSPSDPVPAYHGHLHNNLVQLAAEFGLPVAAAALVFVVMLFWDLRRQYRRTIDRDLRFLSSTALMGLTGFLISGFCDYTYGHSLALILLSFAVFAPLIGPLEGVNEWMARTP
jgi:O-antigen ligase